VPQDSNDERLEKTFTGLRESDATKVGAANIPKQWGYFTYQSLTSLITSGSRGWKKWYSETGAIFIRTQNIKTDNLLLDDVAFVDLPESAEGMRAQVLKDDILITITGANVTKAARIKVDIPEAYVSQHIALTRPRWSAMSQWLHLCFTSHGSARGALEQLAYGAKPGLNLKNIRDVELPVPPLAEQHRIVAKVDELMALCDRLKADLVDARARQAHLADTLIDAALAAA
jgi:type I restriction enzyme, S subunit